MTQNIRTLWVRRILSLAAIAFVLILVCVGSSLFFAKYLTDRSSGWRKDMSGWHQWLHQVLKLTKDEQAAIDSFEGEYHHDRDGLEQEFDSRIADLRQILVESDEYVLEVDVAIHRIHEVHGQLQELSIKHYYDMLNVLPPEKQAMLRELAVKALSQPE